MTSDGVSPICNLDMPLPITITSTTSLYVRVKDILFLRKATLGQSCVRVCVCIGPASLARENEAGGSWGQEVHILHVNI